MSTAIVVKSSQAATKKKRGRARRKPSKGGAKAHLHTLEKPEYPHRNKGRTVITSIATLQSDWKKLSIDLLTECILFLDCDRSWVFHDIKGEAAYAFHKTGFDARSVVGGWMLDINDNGLVAVSHSKLSYLCGRYVDLDPELKLFILKKEEDGHVFWWRPHKSWALASEFFMGIVDPARGDRFTITDKHEPEPLHYFPLILSKSFWQMLGDTENWSLSVHTARKLGLNSQQRFPRFTV